MGLFQCKHDLVESTLVISNSTDFRPIGIRPLFVAYIRKPKKRHIIVMLQILNSFNLFLDMEIWTFHKYIPCPASNVFGGQRMDSLPARSTTISDLADLEAE